MVYLHKIFWSVGELQIYSTKVIWRSKIHEDDRFSFSKIPSFSVFVLALKFPQISQNSAKSSVVSLQKEQLFVVENHDFCKSKWRYQNVSYERPCEKTDFQLFKEQKFVKVNSKKISISYYPTAIYKLGSQKQFSKKWKINDSW